MSDPPDELRRQLSTLWKVARSGLGTMKEVVVRSSQSGRIRIDVALLHRERDQLLVELGERVCACLDESDDGELPESLRELRALRERVREVEARARASAVRASDNAFGAPRGFEPEAAVDYGDDLAVEDVPSTDEPAAPPPAPRATRARSSAGKRSSPRKKTNHDSDTENDTKDGSD